MKITTASKITAAITGAAIGSFFTAAAFLNNEDSTTEQKNTAHAPQEEEVGAPVTDADLCLVKAFDDIEHNAKKLIENSPSYNPSERYEYNVPENNVNRHVTLCEKTTGSKISEQSSAYTDGEGYNIIIPPEDPYKDYRDGAYQLY
ncbi:MAG: hypothetical protein CMH27_03985 [Micavibrio sp.]|nr:hypothetical protein [Micavibrio sp.]|tara:strand:- start:411 stop:848 length:438 start_codon:yes stop_codon:yes gene_type:complete